MLNRLTEHIMLYEDGLRTGILLNGENSILFNWCSGHEELLSGVPAPQTIYCTHHNRSAVGGALSAPTGVDIVCPENERHLFEETATYWGNWRNRYHTYHQRPGAEALPNPVAISHIVRGGESFGAGPATITVADTPGPSDGAVSYIVEVDGQRIVFCGDLICGDGQVWALHMLQKGFGCVSDYHGFMGARPLWQASLARIAALKPDIIVPSRGPLVHAPAAAIHKLSERLDALWDNYVGASALNHYFPDLLVPAKAQAKYLPEAPTLPPPDYLRRLPRTTSFALCADDGAVLLIDCGSPTVSEILTCWQQEGQIGAVECCWITHYHDDHTDALGQLVIEQNCRLLSNRTTAEISNDPTAWFLPYQSHAPAPPITSYAHDESWLWHEYRLTCLDLPGQTLYDAGLLVEGHGARLLLCGDTFSPTGLDDYCCGNRNWLGPNTGMTRCLELVRHYQITHIVNQHQEMAFRFDETQLNWLERNLTQRYTLAAALTPWDDPNFALDPAWAHIYPYEQRAFAGSSVDLALVIMNHSAEPGHIIARPELPKGWPTPVQTLEATVPPHREIALRTTISIPDDAVPGTTVVPFCITWQGDNIGSPCHALLRIRSPHEEKAQ